ncbi:MAG TPA: divergent polysaccharide deacetylase family protein, partial [Pseudomonadales bacterium]
AETPLLTVSPASLSPRPERRGGDCAHNLPDPCLSRVAGRGLALMFSLCIAGTAVAQSVDEPTGLPAISIIIDDLGYRRLDGLRALELPGPVAYAFLPHTPYASRLAGIAFQLDKEVLLHVPMESELDKALGPGGLTSAMARLEVRAALDAGLASVPHVSGINNHMGSALTREPLAMQWVMEWMSSNGPLYFVDSLTSADSVAMKSASNAGLHAIERDVFLDASPDTEQIRRQFQRLIAIARERGTGLAIGHPYPQTLSVLRNVLLKPSYYGVKLVSVRDLITRRARKSHVRSTDPARNHHARPHYAHNTPITVAK